MTPARMAAAIVMAIAAGCSSPERSTAPDARASILPKGAPTTFLQPRPIGRAIVPRERPQIAHVTTVDLDGDRLIDVLACDMIANQVIWIRQAAAGTFTEVPLGSPIDAPAHAEAVDIDRDGDLDVLVASLGVLFPSNAKIGAVVVLENVGGGRFTNRVLLRDVARVSDVRAGDLDGDGDLDLAVAQFGYDQGETRWLENRGGWQFASTVLQPLAGPINVEIVDIDQDGDLDIVSLVSQEWEEVHAFVNDGRGRFTPRLVWGSTNDDFGSSWLTAADLDKDGDQDFLYSNGDAFDYAPAGSRPWHGVQWIENLGSLRFAVHRIADLSGASSPQPADVDADGDLDVVVASAYNDWDAPAAQSLVWLENDGGMRFALHDIANAPTHLITLSAGDVTGDGKIDVVTGGMHVSRPYNRLGRVTLWTNAHAK